MSFGGSVSAMLTTLKNNKISRKENKLGHLEYKSGVPIGKKLEFKNSMSQTELLTFRKKLENEKKKSTFVLITIYLVILTICILSTILYFF